MYIVASLFAFAFGIFFLASGLYAFKTNRLPFKTGKRKSLDSPRAVAIMFTYLGTFALILAPNLFLSCAYGEKFSVLAWIFSRLLILVGFIGGSILMILAGVYGLKTRKIFCLRQTPKSRPLIKKFYKLVNSCAIICGVIVPSMVVAIQLFPAVENILTISLSLLAVTIFVMCGTICYIELKSS